MLRSVCVLLLVGYFGDRAQAALILNATAVNPSLFRVTTFYQGSAPISMSQLNDGSLLAGFGDYGSASTLQRLTDVNLDGVADGPGSTLFTSAGGGPVTGLVKAGNYYFAATTENPAITILQPGANPGDPMTPIGTLQFTFPADWYHPSTGIAARPVAGQPDTYDLVFNVGSQYDAQLSTSPVALSGLMSASLDGDSLYSVRIQINGSTATASNLQKVVTGIRNVLGMGFHPVTGDFYFADNAIDGPDPNDPPQAEELNVIPASVFGTMTVNFGYPNCYIQYRTGAQIGSGCELPLATFQPLPFPNGFESEGPAQIAFAPTNFPAGFNNGLFIGFAGKGSLSPANDENAIVYYDFGTGNYIHFVESGTIGVGLPAGLYSNQNSLFIADLDTGAIHQITAADVSVPEPSSGTLMIIGLGLAFYRWRTRIRA